LLLDIYVKVKRRKYIAEEEIYYK